LSTTFSPPVFYLAWGFKTASKAPQEGIGMASKTHEEQEAIAAQYAQSLYTSVEGIAPENIKYGRESILRRLSGQPHQIDVSVWGHQDLMLIECKHREKRNIGVDMVLTFFGRLYDIRQHFLYNEKMYTIHGIMVASTPFDPGAKVVAPFYGIDLTGCEFCTYS